MSGLAQLARTWGRDSLPYSIQQFVLRPASKDAARDRTCGHLRMYVSNHAGLIGVLATISFTDTDEDALSQGDHLITISALVLGK